MDTDSDIILNLLFFHLFVLKIICLFLHFTFPVLSCFLSLSHSSLLFPLPIPLCLPLSVYVCLPVCLSVSLSLFLSLSPSFCIKDFYKIDKKIRFTILCNIFRNRLIFFPLLGTFSVRCCLIFKKNEKNDNNNSSTISKIHKTKNKFKAEQHRPPKRKL